MINFNSINKSLMKNMGSALVNMAMIASPLSTGAATHAYYAARKANYGRNNSYLIDEGLNSLRTGRWNNNLASKKDRTNIETTTSADDLVLRKNVAVRELVVVDSHIKNRELFSKLIRPGVELVRIEGNSNGFDNLMNKLAAYEKLDAIHLFAHSQQGQILLGNQLVAKTTIETSVQAFSRFNHTLKEGGELRVYNSELESIRNEGENLEISKGTVAKPLTSKVSISSDELSINKGDINSYPEDGSIARSRFDLFAPTTFSFPDDIIGNYTKTVQTTSGAYTLKIESTTRAMQVYSGYTYLGPEDFQPETVWKISLSGGQTFDLESLTIQEYGNQSQTIYIEANNSNKSADLSFTTTLERTINQGDEISNTDFDGISHFFIKGKTTINSVANSFIMGLREVQLDNITAANSAPEITDTSAGQTVNDNSTISPFSGITVTDDGSSVSATITLDAAAKGALSGTGLNDDGGGVYSVNSTTPSDLQSKLRALIFTPTANRSATNETTTFTVVVSDGSKSDTDNTTTVISNAVAPVISEITAVTTPTTDNTPSYTFTTNETGTFSLGGSCGTSSSTTIGSTGNQTITITDNDNSSALSDGTYSDCTVTVTDAGGKASSALSISSFSVDATAPTVLEMSSDVNNSSFKVGANINIYVQYSEEVFVTGTPQLTLETGSTDRTIDYVDRSSSTLRFVYTVQAGDVSSDLDVQSTSALTLNGGTIKDAVGNNAVLTLPVDPDGSALTAKNLVIDGVVPSISSLGLNNSNAFIEVFFNEAVYSTNGGSGALEASDLVLSLSGGAASVISNVVLKNIDGTTDLAGGEDRMRVSFDLDATADGGETITVNFADGSSVFDAVGNAAVATQSNNTRTLNDLIKPHVTGVSLAADNSYLDVTFNEDVYNDNCLGGALESSDFDLKITGGSASLNAITSVTKTDGTAASGGETSLRINFTLTGTADGSETIEVDLQGTAVFDQNGLEADADQTSNNTASLNDKTVPTVTVTTAASDPTNSSPFFVTITFSESVTGFTSDKITVGNGAVSNFAGSGTTYTADITPSGNGNVTVDVAAGVATDGASNSNTAATQLSIEYDGTSPSVTSITRQSPSGSPTSATSATFRVTFSENVINVGVADFAVSGGGSASVSGASVFTANSVFDIVVSNIDSDGTLDLNFSGGQDITDNAGNGFSGTISSEQTYTIDQTAPTITSVSVPADGTYSSGENLDFTLNFSEDVNINEGCDNVVKLNITIGSTTREAFYQSGDGTSALVFRYTIQSGEVDADGIAVNSISFGDGDIYDAAGNSSSTTLNSVGATSAVLVDALPTVTLTTDNSSISEDGGTATLTAALSDASVFDVTVSLSYSGTAINGTEYNSSASSSITITAGQTSADAGTIITAINNNTDAADKSIDVAIISVTNGTEDGDQEVSITITDDDNSPIITASQSFSVDEDATDATVVGNVLATDADAGTTFSNWSITAGNGDGVFAINSSTGQLVINDKTNLDFETTESYTLTLTVTDGANLSAEEDVTIEVNDLNDNNPVVTASQTFDVDEDAANTTSVGTVAATDADANTSFSGWFITAGNGDGVFAINSSTGEITVTDNSNLDYDVTSSYSLTVTVTDGTNTSSGQTVTININKVPGITIAETSSSTSTTEAGGTDSFTAVLDVQPGSDVVLSVTSGDLGEGTVSPATLTFTSANWNTPQTVTVTGVDDNIIDGTANYDITISVVDVSSDDSYDPVSDITVNVGNTDDDVAGFTVTQTSGSTSTTEAGGTDSFTVELDAEPSSNVVIDVTSGDTGEATASVASLTFTSANWDTPQTVTMTGVDDDIIDGTQTFNITLSIDDSNSDDDFDPLGDQTVSLDNIDDDVAGFTVTQSDGSTEVSEAGTTDDFTVVLDAEPASNVVINVTSGDTGEATISAASLTFTTANWDNPQTITVTGTDDSDLDGSQTTTITLSIDTGSSDDDFDALGDQSVSVTTEDDDTPVISFSSTASSGVESVNSVNITVDNTLASLSTITVDYAVSGTATGSGTDYTLASGTLTFAANSTSETITIASIVNDEIVELDETVIITLSNPTNAILGTNTVHTYTITDDDEALITIANVTADEEDGTATVTLSLDKAIDGGFDVDVSTTDGTATTADSDYTAVSSSTITFAGTAGETQSFDIVLGSDTKLEADETLTVAMSNLVPVTVSSADIDITDGATVTIANDDTASVTIADVDGNEDDGAITLTATLDNLVDGGFTVDVSTVDGTATTADSDYTSVTSQTLTFAGTAGETQTFTVTPTSDETPEGDETLTVSMSNLAGTSLGVDVSDQATVTIIGDDDGTAPVFENSTPSARDIGGTDFTLDIDFDEAATAYYVVLADGATAPTSAEVKAGTGSGGAAAVTSDSFDFFTGSYSNDLGVSGLSSETDYDVYVVGEDIAGNLMTNPTLVEITTPDVTSPTVTNVTSSTANGSYKVGDVINIQVVFSEVVILSDYTQLQIQLETGSSDYYVASVSGSGTNTINFTHIVQAGSETSDLDYKDTNSLDLSLSATLQDAAGNDVVLTLPTPGTANSLSSSKDIIIDTTAPNAPSVTSISADTGVNGTDGKTNDNTLTISGTLPESNVTVEVFIDGISIGQAVMGLSTFSLDYSGTELEDGEYEITAKATDVAGNTGALSSVFNLTIDTTAPDAPTIDLDPIYDTGFSDSDNLTNSTSLKLTGVAEIGSDVEVFVNNVSQGVTAPDVITGEWFTIVSSLPQDQNIEVKAVATDYVGNTGAASEVLTVTIDNTVADPAFSPADNAVGVLPSANLILTFEEEVRKSGNTISIRRSSDNSILESFDVSSDKVSVNGSVVTINPDNALLPAATEFYVVIGQGAFVDNAGNDYMGISNNTTWTFTTIDAAVVTAVSVPSAETYGIGDNLDFELTFSQEVTMTGSPTIDLTIGSEIVTASLQGSVTSSTTATFRYTVKEGDLDADGISIGSTINLNGGTLKDAFDIDALADLNNVPSTAAILVDGVKPTPTITSDAGSLTNAAFTATFTYDEAVSGLELGDISITNGTASNFTNVTAGTVWSATITPTADGETTVTLNADVANDLAGNASKAGNTVSTTFDGTAPTVTSITRAESDQIPTGTTTRSFTVVFSEDVTGVDVSDFEVVTTGSATASINTVSAADAKTYTVNVNGISGEGTIGLNAKDDDSILDAATNPLGGTFVGEIYTTNFVPTDISMSSSSIQENNAVGAEIGTFTTTDADAGDSFTYSLVSGTGDSDNGSFTMSADKLLAAEVFDFEIKDSYSIRVKTEDGFGGSYEEALTISITNEGEAIIVISGDGVFDQTILGLSSTKNWTVENQGDVATEVRIISSSQGFSFAPGSVQVNPGETKNITAVFRPREARAYTGVVVFNFDITDNIKDNVVEIGLSGEGVIVTGTDNGQISEEQINVFPNPATTSITIDLSELHGLPVDIQMVNPTGVSKLEKEGYDKPELTIDITNFESGLYIIQFSNERSLVRKKVLIRR